MARGNRSKYEKSVTEKGHMEKGKGKGKNATMNH